MTRILTIVMAVVVLLGASAAQAGDPIWHDPWLNWDFINQTGLAVDDLDIIVDSPTFSPNLGNPNQAWSMPFPAIGSSTGDFDGDGDTDTKITYSGAVINPGQTAHGGLYMLGSGAVLDAYWTLGGVKVGASTAITYEQTRVEGDPDLYMELNIAPGFFLDPLNAGEEPAWTNIRTFVNLPAELLNLPDIGSGLDLGTLAAYEVTPKLGGPAGPDILLSDVITANLDSSPIDIFLANIAPEFSNENYEALLVATVLNQPTVIGTFWNLNPQSPEPATMGLLGVGALALLRRKRRK
ncbi:hypothetical protein LCGC14_0333440 [marine sediment metagenome]|uniref:Ice-binding protein C-terminal domain-containing protein n=1 Tax=marine sediment metagenome TaxID=412755 RepID=A0A0F9W318_9ZZZZ|nr:PEP-CTERM sorting domain-containing protein [Phycisphaerae bacterium]HDZ43802.1 PEP-CTERM sorting domain-containing protein [Phycisphaerae bacterium]